MGRLPALTLACALASDACDAPAKPSVGRSEQVVSSGSAAVASSAPSVAASEHAAPAPRGALCDKSVDGRTLPKGSVPFADATGGVSDRAGVGADGKHVRWLSFFASWCGPCKEEMPRIDKFAKKLAADGVPVDVAYVSIDDDLRQLTAFFGQQPEGGLKSSYWLKDGPVRNGWLASLKMGSEPALPEHGLFDARGKLRCWVAGAIDDGDYPQLLAALR
jgi:thiol-disulfide isomerase/thioredoxin